MTDLLPEARRVLELARQERTPSDEHRAEMERRIAYGVSLAVLASASNAGSAAASMHAAASSATKSALLAEHALALKLGLVGLLAVASAVTSFAIWNGGRTNATHDARARPLAGAESLASPTAPEPHAVVVVPERARSVSALAPVAAPAAAAAPRRSARSHEARSGADTLAVEIELLHAAQVAWREGRAGAALERVREHSARFPRSSLALERDALQVLALCQLGREPEARTLAERWLKRAGRSPLRASIEQSCAVR